MTALPRPTYRSPVDHLRSLVADGASGQLVIAVEESSDIRLFLESGRLAWGRSRGSSRGFTHVLRDCGVERSTIEALIDECRERELPISQLLVTSGLLSEEQVHVALRAQVRSALADLYSVDGPAKALFVPRREPSDAEARVTFDFDELWLDLEQEDSATIAAFPSAAVLAGLSAANSAANSTTTDLTALTAIDGFVGAALVKTDTGETLQELLVQSYPLDVVASGNALMVAAKLETLRALGLHDTLDDIVVSLGGHYHLMRPIDVDATRFITVVLERPASNLALARFALKGLVQKLEG